MSSFAAGPRAVMPDLQAALDQMTRSMIQACGVPAHLFTPNVEAPVPYTLPDLPPAPHSTVAGLVRAIIESRNPADIEPLMDALQDADRKAELYVLRKIAGVLIHGIVTRKPTRYEAHSQARNWDSFAHRLAELFLFDLFDAGAALRACAARLLPEPKPLEPADGTDDPDNDDWLGEGMDDSPTVGASPVDGNSAAASLQENAMTFNQWSIPKDPPDPEPPPPDDLHHF